MTQSEQSSVRSSTHSPAPPPSSTAIQPLRAAWNWLAGHDVIVLLAVLLVVSSVLGFIKLAEAVSGGQTRSFDEAILRALRDPSNPEKLIGPAWMTLAVRDVTSLGGVAVLVLVTLIAFGFLLVAGKRHAAVFLLIAAVGGMAANSLLKDYFERPRPTVVPMLMEERSFSFPSGHSMMSAVIYLTLGALLDRFVEGRRLKLYCLSVAMLLTFLVGCTRMFLGVHYPTDVLGGWVAGLTWAVLCWLAARYLQKRGAVERAPV
jgi:undecaprenyl-diphosphatase